MINDGPCDVPLTWCSENVHDALARNYLRDMIRSRDFVLRIYMTIYKVIALRMCVVFLIYFSYKGHDVLANH